jgi:hypothetical protein
LGLPLASYRPLFYRSHTDFDKLMRIPMQQNKLIFVTRNPKELILKSFFSASPDVEKLDARFIANFLKDYLGAFAVYDSWHPENRLLVFYEDFIQEEDAMLLNILKFMDESPLYFEDFIMNKQEYISKLLESYREQHKNWKLAGVSSLEGPQPLFYSSQATPETLLFLDESLETAAPLIWERYLKRFNGGTRSRG